MKRKLCPPKPTRLAVVLVSVFLMLLTACSDSDKTFINPLGSDIYGLWYADYQASGTIGSDNIPYSRVLQAVKFNSDGTGRWWWAAFNADNATTPLQFNGGQYNGAFDYTVAADGTITAKPQKDNCPMPRSFRFADGAITFDDNGAQKATRSCCSNWRLRRTAPMPTTTISTTRTSLPRTGDRRRLSTSTTA